MDILVLGAAQVRELLPMDECIDVVGAGLKILRQGDAVNPLRPVMHLPQDRGLLGLMPAYLGGNINAMGIKIVGIMPQNQGTQYDSHPGAVLHFEAEHGQLLAVMDASEITAIRTAAASGLATRLLAREDAGDLAILGSGVQARSHLEAMRAVRDLRRVRVWGRNADNARRFAEREGERFGIKIEVMAEAQAAVEGADLICTTTGSPEPILMGDWLAPGAHLNVVGSSIPITREVDTAAMVKSKLFVDYRESTLNEAGDFLIPKMEGALDDDHIQAELGEIMLGQHAGRGSPDDITLFKSLGVGVEDVASADHIYKKALERGIGTKVPFGEHRVQ